MVFDPLLRPSWSNGQLKKLGKCIRDDATPDGLLDYDEVMLWYNDLAETVAEALKTRIDWQGLLPGRNTPTPTARAKTIDTLRDKLRRESGIQLPNIQDVAGVRVEAEMTLAEQDAVALEIARMFDHDLDAVKDRRDGEHSGYRAVHVWLRLPAGRVEVQIRTHLQSQWANAYELAGDLFGRGIRYGEEAHGEAAESVVQALHRVSRNIANLEENAMKPPRIAASIANLEDILERNRDVLDQQQIHEVELEVLSMRANLEAGKAEVKRMQESYMSMLGSLEQTLQETIDARRGSQGARLPH